jgi:CheY-like chemotaxis protein
LDPRLQAQLDFCFDKTRTGRQEALKMDVDILRRLQRCRETERITRAYGVMHLVTPVKFRGRTVYAFDSGPIKVSPWTPAERETLAGICGLTLQQLPSGLESGSVFYPEQIESIVASQTLEAERMAALLEYAADAELSGGNQTSTPAIPLPLFDLIQPGFADHLDLLFHTVQKTIQRATGPLSASEKERLVQSAQRGRHLANEIRRIGQQMPGVEESFNLHTMLEARCAQLQETFPGLRWELDLQADTPILTANPHTWQHVLNTLLSGVADGLPANSGRLHIHTRNSQRDGRECLHVQIRDGGGFETFAGVGRPLDQEILLEQNEDNQLWSEWMALVENVDADLQVQREDGTVSRIDLWIYPSSGTSGVTEIRTHPSVWIVEDEDAEYDRLQHMLQGTSLQPVRLRNAQELRDTYPLATTGPALVLLKYLLPDQRGAILRTWLYEQDADLPVILYAGFAETHPGIATAHNLPSTLYLQKPFDRQILLDRIHMFLNTPLA